tara:strand:- start:71 stop:679 length:609 start_codon:yes stop_codon:yes gene_type:complete
MSTFRHEPTGKRFLFVHIPRTAGRFFGENLLVNGWEMEQDDHWERIEGFEMAHFHRKMYERYLNVKGIPHIVIVRNPIDRFKSAFSHLPFLYDSYGYFISDIINNLHILSNDIRTYNYYRPQVEFISNKTHIWKFEDGFGDDFSAWISNILGVDFSLKVNAPLSSIDKAAKSRGRVEFSDEVVDYLKKFYHNDIKQFYPELK